MQPAGFFLVHRRFPGNALDSLSLAFAVCGLRFAVCGLRFALAKASRATGWAGAWLFGIAVRRNPAWTAGFRGRSVNFRPRPYGLAASCTHVCHATDARVAPVTPAIQAPAHPVAAAPWRVEKRQQCL